MQKRKSSSPTRTLGSTNAPDLIYGVHSVLSALNNPERQIINAWASRNMAEKFADDFQRAKVTPEILHPRQLDSFAGPDSVHQGLVIKAKPLEPPRLDQISRTGIVVLLDQVTDPHNVGAILRSCAAFDVTALVATARHSPQGSAILNKSASGAVEHVPFIKVTNLSRAMTELQEYGFTLIGLDSEAPVIFDALPKLSGPCALVLGAEGKGLRKLTRDKCDHLVRFSLPGKIHSLNVSNATVLGLHCITQAID